MNTRACPHWRPSPDHVVVPEAGAGREGHGCQGRSGALYRRQGGAWGLARARADRRVRVDALVASGRGPGRRRAPGQRGAWRTRPARRRAFSPARSTLSTPSPLRVLTARYETVCLVSNSTGAMAQPIGHQGDHIHPPHNESRLGRLPPPRRVPAGVDTHPFRLLVTAVEDVAGESGVPHDAAEDGRGEGGGVWARVRTSFSGHPRRPGRGSAARCESLTQGPPNIYPPAGSFDVLCHMGVVLKRALPTSAESSQHL